MIRTGNLDNQEYPKRRTQRRPKKYGEEYLPPRH